MGGSLSQLDGTTNKESFTPRNIAGHRAEGNDLPFEMAAFDIYA